MRCEFHPLPAAILAAVFLAAGVAAAKKPDHSPLVRMDLLKALPPDPAAPIRDIFSPGRAVAAPEIIAPGEIPAGEESDVEGTPTAAPGEPALDLAYIGWVTSGRKVVALLITEGQTLAVVEGEEIVPGLKVDKIGPDRIEVIGPGGKRTSVPVQGEQP